MGFPDLPQDVRYQFIIFSTIAWTHRALRRVLSMQSSNPVWCSGAGDEGVGVTNISRIIQTHPRVPKIWREDDGRHACCIAGILQPVLTYVDPQNINNGKDIPHSPSAPVDSISLKFSERLLLAVSANNSVCTAKRPPRNP